MMKNWLSKLFAHRGDHTAENHIMPNEGRPESISAASDPLEQKKEIQALRIELESCQETINHLHREIERLRARQEELLAENLSTRLVALYREVSGPASQILTQNYLLEIEQKPVLARDVLVLARSLVRVLERHGLVMEGKVGEQVKFDPNRHSPMSANLDLQAGQPVTVRFTGASYAGKIIRKAGVE